MYKCIYVVYVVGNCRPIHSDGVYVSITDFVNLHKLTAAGTISPASLVDPYSWSKTPPHYIVFMWTADTINVLCLGFGYIFSLKRLVISDWKQ